MHDCEKSSRIDLPKYNANSVSPYEIKSCNVFHNGGKKRLED